MYKIKVLLAVVGLSLGYGVCCYAQKVKPTVKDVLYPAQGVSLSGYLADRLSGDLNNRILAQDVDRLVDVFKPKNRTETRQWQSEFWGKWFTSAVLAYKYQPTTKLKAVLDNAVEGLLATQTTDGYIGNYAETARLKEWDIWGRKYCMLGLLAYHELFNDKKSLQAAAGIADNLMDDIKKQDGLIVNKGNYRGMAASSVLEPFCLLYNQTGNKKHLDFALEIVKQWETPEGPQLIGKSTTNVGQRFAKPQNWYSPEQGQKAYEMMSCYEGLLELYRITGNETYKQAVESTWENILNTEINIAGSGASTEMWFSGKAVQDQPIHHYQETCVTVTWLKLSSQLLRLTGNPKYADQVEKTYLNALLGSLSLDGANWAKYTPLNGKRLPGSEQCGMGLNCCEASGPRGLFLYPLQTIMQRADGIQVNYYTEGTYNFKTPKGQFSTISQHTTYPKSGTIVLNVNVPKSEEFEIYLRIPEWSKNSKLNINGEYMTIEANNARLKRLWKTDDEITLELDMRGRIATTGTGAISAAITRGPIVLARDSRFENNGLNAVLKPYGDKDGYIALKEITPPNPYNTLMLYEAKFIPEAYTERGADAITIPLCDYASAGNGTLPSYFKVWWPQLITPSAK